jgi:O-antigen/teichoic acid export membrane protein
MMNNNAIGKGVIYLYVEAITVLFSGYIFWLLLSKIINPASIGLASTIIAFATIIFSVAFMGVSGGAQRYIANGIAENRSEHVQGMINSSLLITTLGVLISAIIILVFRDSIGTYFDIGLEYTILSIGLFISLVFAELLRAIIIPSLKVKVITMTSVVSAIIKFAITFALVFLEYDVYGIILGFLVSSIVSILIYAFAIKNKIYKIIPDLKLFIATKEIWVASITFWIPTIITTIGSQLGTITVYLATGSGDAGVYFISFSIITGIMVMTTVLSSVAYPTISTIKDGKKRATWRLIKISLLMTIPLSDVLLFYPKDILSLFGPGYTTGSSTLQILALASLPTCIFTGIGVLLYSYGHNRGFLFQGLSTSMPRVVLYFLFVPIMGGIGAALSYLIGSIAGAVISLLYAKRIRMKFFYKQILFLFMIPIVIAIPVKLLDIHAAASIIIILVTSYVVFIAMRLIDSQDVEDILRILPNNIARYIASILPAKNNGDK